MELKSWFFWGKKKPLPDYTNVLVILVSAPCKEAKFAEIETLKFSAASVTDGDM